MGPFVIHDLSSSGAVHLATIDGEPMTSWISGCRLKKYHEPLTQDILQRLHATKQRNQKKVEQKAQAQAEAKERREKLRRKRAGMQELIEDTKRLRIYEIQEKDSSLPIRRPYLLIEVGTEYQTEFALFDTGADVNAISFEVWNRLGKPTLCESKTTLTSFSRETNHVEGYLDLPIYIGNTNLHHRFYVMKPGKANTPVILGQPWQRTYNGVPNWRKEGINFEFDQARLFTPFLRNEDFATDTESESEEDYSAHKEEKKLDTLTTEQGSRQETPKGTVNSQEARTFSQTKNQSLQGTQTFHTIWVPKRLAQAQTGSPQMWIPRRKAKQQTTFTNNAKTMSKKKTSKRTATKRSRNARKKTEGKQIWVKKTLLQAQQSSHYKWIPKSILRTTNTTQQSTQRKQTNKPKPAQQKENTRWVPKQALHKQGYYEGATHIWLPKQSKENTEKHLKKTKPVSTNANPKLQEKRWVKKDENKRQLTRQKPPLVPSHTQRRATAQEKGKWIPKTAKGTPQQDMDELPSTSKQGYETRHEEIIQKHELQRPNPLDAAQHLAFILKAFNSKQLREHLKRFLIHAIGTRTSPANALGLNLLQDHFLAQQ